MSQDRLAYPISEAAHQLGLSRSRLYELKDQGRIHFTKIDGRVVVQATELRRFLADLPTVGGSQAQPLRHPQREKP
jgi:excisionase family DNA binding protein